MFASTLNSRCMRSTMISRCSSPMPEMIVWPVSASECTRKVGSSSASFWSAMPNLSWSALVLGSIATSITGAGNFIAFLALVGVHLEEPAHALAAVLGRVVDVRPAVEHARVYADVREFPDERVRRDLERQRRERRLVGHHALLERLVVVRHVSLDRPQVDRRRQVVDHRIEQLLHALVLERGAAQHGHELSGDGRLPNRVLDLVVRELGAAQILLEERFIVLHRGLDGRVSGFFYGVLVLLGHRLFDERL